MDKSFEIDKFIVKYPHVKQIIKDNNIDVQILKDIYSDFVDYEVSYENQADFISNILRSQPMVHSVKSRIKEPNRLIEKIIRKTADRKLKYGKDFQFNLDNYKNEINDLIGIRVIHIFKDQWQDIHEFITKTWKVIEVTANVRDGDNTKKFEELNIEVRSRISGYRSVHYLVEFYPTNEKVIAEIQVRTIFEEMEIMNIVTKDNKRNQGFASNMLSYILRYANRQEIEKINLEVNENNMPAIKLYKTYGFKVVGKRNKYYKDGSAILMTYYL